MQIKSNLLGVRITDNLLSALRQEAEKERRTVSALVVKVLAEWLRLKGHVNL
jgi:hypothetical protein